MHGAVSQTEQLFLLLKLENLPGKHERLSDTQRQHRVVFVCLTSWLSQEAKTFCLPSPALFALLPRLSVFSYLPVATQILQRQNELQAGSALIAILLGSFARRNLYQVVIRGVVNVHGAPTLIPTDMRRLLELLVPLNRRGG